ncbi:MAG: DNA repair protein RecN [Crocinitomicaceae bacterium]
MLNRLTISNFALIENLNLQFNTGYSVITGETGAGKSIILKALNLLLGDRADFSIIKARDKKCIIEAEFSISNLQLEDQFLEWDLDYDINTIIRREFTTAGKSRLFINDTPTTLNILKQLGGYIINIHSQHETLALFDKQFQLDTLDSFANLRETSKNYNSKFTKYIKQKKILTSLEENAKEQKKAQDYTLFLIDEFTKINFRQLDIDVLLQEAEQIDNWEHIQNQLQSSLNHLSDEQFNPSSVLKSCIESMGKISHLSPNYKSLLDRFNSLKIEMDDIESELSNIVNSSDMDEERMNIVQSQVQDINTLLHKHNCTSGSELAEVLLNLEREIDNYTNLGEDIDSLKKTISEAEVELKKLAKDLAIKRKASAPKFEASIQSLLSELGMPNAELKLEFDTTTTLTKNGFDTIQYLFKTNLGGQFLPISKTASGGELSRLMLSILYIIASVQQLPTLIFDEIDTGVSGEIASKMANLFVKMGLNTQLISITHLPQIAGKASSHYHVYKTVTNNQTNTEVKALSKEERIIELAKMMSGENVSDKAVENAKQLLKA